MATGMKGSHAQERRRSPRIAHRVPVSIVNPREVIQAETKDLSASGAYCTLSRFLPAMSKLELNFTLPGASAHPIRCTGVIVRIEPAQEEPGRTSYQAAVFFSDLSAREREALTHFIQQRLQASPSAAAA